MLKKEKQLCVAIESNLKLLQLFVCQPGWQMRQFKRNGVTINHELEFYRYNEIVEVNGKMEKARVAYIVNTQEDTIKYSNNKTDDVFTATVSAIDLNKYDSDNRSTESFIFDLHKLFKKEINEKKSEEADLDKIRKLKESGEWEKIMKNISNKNQ